MIILGVILNLDSENKFACLLDIFINEKGCLYDAFVVLETASNDKYRNVLRCEMLILCLIAKVYRIVSNMYAHKEYSVKCCKIFADVLLA